MATPRAFSPGSSSTVTFAYGNPCSWNTFSAVARAASTRRRSRTSPGARPKRLFSDSRRRSGSTSNPSKRIDSTSVGSPSRTVTVRRTCSFFSSKVTPTLVTRASG